MSRSEAYAAGAGLLLLTLAVLTIGSWLVGGGSTSRSAALVCLVGALVAFVLAWRWSWSEQPGGSAFGGEPARIFPIADYDDLWVSEILPLLLELDDDELEDVLRYEKARAARPSVVTRIEALLARSRRPRGR